ncbi:MAG: prolyl oligopeptidase family serine peptidase [Pirellulaceae bacterium]
MKSSLGSSLAFAVALIVSGRAVGQGWSMSDVDRDNVEVHWADSGDWLWYEVDAGPDTSEYFVVDLVSGERKPLFESTELSAALGEQIEQEVSVADLSGMVVINVERQGVEFLFEYEGQDFQWRTGRLLPIDANELDEAFDYQEVFTRLRRSRSGGGELEMKVANGTQASLTCFWISGSGEAIEYETLTPGQEFSQHTFAGHLWSLRNPSGEEVVRFIASRATRRFTISDETIEAFREFEKAPNRTNRIRRSPSEFYLEDFNVWRRQPEGDLRLTSDGSAENRYQRGFQVSPDEKFLAAIREEQVEKRQLHLVESSPREGLQPRHRTVDYVKPGDPIDRPRLRIINLETHDSFELSDEVTPNPWSISRLQWLPSGERLLCLYNERGHQKLQVHAIDPSTGETSALVDERSETFVDYSQKTYLHVEEDGQHLIWASERSGFNHLYRVPIEVTSDSGQDEESELETDKQAVPEPAAITQGDWVVRKVVEVDEAEGVIWFEASGIVAGQDPYYRHLCRVNLDGTGFVRVTDGDGDHRWKFSPDRKFLIDRFSRVDMPTVTTVRDAISGEIVCELERANWPRLLNKGWTVPERFVAKGRDGETDIYGVIVKPSRTMASEQRYPVVEKIYAGPHSAHVPKSFSLLRQEHKFAEEGFVVVRIDGMGTSHRGKTFHDVCWKNLADAGFPDRKLWIRAAAKKNPEMDLSRVGIFGGSAGGQNAMRAVLDHHDFYHVAVADCGCHDNRMDKIWWNEAWMGWPVDESYVDSSNVEHAHRLNGKLLLIVGEQDTNVDPASTLQVVDALIKANKDFDFLILPGVGHGAAESQYGNRRRLEFLKQHLLAVPQG